MSNRSRESIPPVVWWTFISVVVVSLGGHFIESSYLVLELALECVLAGLVGFTYYTPAWTSNGRDLGKFVLVMIVLQDVLLSLFYGTVEPGLASARLGSSIVGWMLLAVVFVVGRELQRRRS